MQERELYLGNRSIGMLYWEKKNNSYLLTASCPMEEGWIYRVMIEDGAGQYHILGVMTPSYGKFYCRKTLLLSAEKQWGPQLGRIERAEILRTAPGELQPSPLPFPLELFLPFSEEEFKLDPLLCRSLSHCGALMRKWGDHWYLAAPLEADRPFGLVSVFCMASPLMINGKQYAVVGIDAAGAPFFALHDQ